MKRINKKGFTLIELLAVIVIMGILMMVAIPAVSRTIENARKDTFIDNAKAYATAVQTLWSSDGLVCGDDNTVASAVDNGDYFVEINTRGQAISDDGKSLNGETISVPTILEQGGKSSWGNRDVAGYVRIRVNTTPSKCTTESEVRTAYYCKALNKVCVRNYKPDSTVRCAASNAIVVPAGKKYTQFFIALSDGTHGIDENTSNDTQSYKLTSKDVTMSNLKYISIPATSYKDGTHKGPSIKCREN